MTWINYGSKSIKEIYLWNPWGSRLPSAYQEVEYIQSSWTQYIQISSAFNTSYKVVADAQVSSTSWDTILFWISNSQKWATWSNRHRYWVNIYNWNVNMIASWSDWVTVTSANTSRHTYTINQNTWMVDSTSKTINYSSYSWYWEWITLFWYREIGEWWVNYKISAKVYSFKIYNTSWGLINDLVPCYRISDNVVWMYDLVNNTFYTNSWSWTFTKWADVTYNYTPIKAVYYWSKKMRPASTTITYNFISAWSVSKMQSDWWVFGRNSWTATSWREFTSNWLHNTDTGSTSKFVRVTLPHNANLSNASKITITSNVYLNRWSRNWASEFWVTNMTGFNDTAFIASWWANSTMESWYNWYWVNVAGTWNWNRTSLNTGNYEVTLILDLVNKIWKTQITWYSEITLFLSDDNIASIKASPYLLVHFDNVWCYYKDITMTIE